MKIAYIGSMQDTFVINELEAHDQAGWKVLPLASSKPCSFEFLSKVMVKWNKLAVFRHGIFIQIGATLREIVTHPVRFLQVCLWLIILLFHSPLEFLKAIHELMSACYLVSHVRCFGAEHIHVHFASRSLNLGLMLGILANLPISCTVHAFDIFTRNPASLRYRLAKCRFIAAISQFNIKYLRDVCGEFIADLCHVVRCGINLEKFKSISRAPECGRMICVCRLTPKKGLDVALRACAKLRDDNVEFFFDIIGEGAEQEHLERLIRQFSLTDKVKLHGAKPNDQLMKLFNRSFVFLMPCVKMRDGDMDGIPVAMMEAMACEIPVISTTISGIPELVTDGVTGLLVPERDVNALAKAIKQLLMDTEKIERFGKAGREYVLKEFSIHDNAAKLRKLIEA